MESADLIAKMALLCRVPKMSLEVPILQGEKKNQDLEQIFLDLYERIKQDINTFTYTIELLLPWF